MEAPEPSEEQEERLPAAGRGSAWLVNTGSKGDLGLEGEEQMVRNLVRLMALYALNSVGAVGFLLLFAGPGLGYGEQVYGNVRGMGDLVALTVLGGLVVLFLLYIFDATYWQGSWRTLKYLLLAASAAALGVSAVFANGAYPGLMVALFMVVFPGIVWLVKNVFFRSLGTSRFLQLEGVALITISGVLLIVWLVWVLDGHLWDRETKVEFAAAMDCDPPAANNDNTCLAAYVLWIAPFLAAINAGVFGVFALLLANSMRNPDSPAVVALRLFCGLLGLAVVGVWVAASVAGGGMQVSNAVNLFIGVGLALLFAVVVGTVGWKNLRLAMDKVAILRRVTASALSSWMKALFLLLLAPAMPFYFVLSAVTQGIRKRGFSFSKPLETEEEKRLLLTLRAHNQLEAMRAWKWTRVLVRVVWICLIYVLINVGVGKFTSVFLSWLNAELASVALGVTTVVFIGVGLVMFLLPPVPGVPVYLAGGIILVKAAEDDLSYVGAIGFCIGVCFFIKLTAIFMQQKFIGEQLSHKVSVRRLVAVNSITIRAVKKILEQPGFSPAKVFILCGGPDWPTSVLTGILRLSVVKMLVGSLPVILLVAPTVLAGAFLLRKDRGGAWESVANVTLAVAALVQISAMVAAAYYIERVAERDRDELAAWPNDQEVEEAEVERRKRTRVFKAVTNWHDKSFPLWMRILLIWNALCAAVATYMIVLFPSSCFQSFTVTDTIDDKLNGNVANIVVSPLGWLAVGLLLVSCSLLSVFYIWAKHRVAHTSEEQVQRMRTELPSRAVSRLNVDDDADQDPPDDEDVEDPARK
eukprot:m.256890 g.256890  ORF g.256890 m.256890 type:complete len:808 (-) comp22704_c1_seq6:126-2549(-)